MVGNGMVAVKKLSRTFDMHENKFLKEIECLMKAKHMNIVRFLGYCSDTQGKIADYEGKLVMADVRNWLLCFDYVPNGSLDKHITDASHGLEWRERYKIIKGICDGLCHLHEKRILHLDLKPANVLLDDHMVPKITDFGLSRCLDKDQTRAFTSNLCGSQGYLAPEFYRGEIAFASDIYSLGIIIMEILTGEKGYPQGDNVLEGWTNRLKATDQRDTQLDQVRVCAKIGTECMDPDPKKRPAARHIVVRLDKMASADYSDGTQLEQVHVCTKIGTGCMDLNPKKRPAAGHVVDRVDKMARVDYSELSKIPRRKGQSQLPRYKLRFMNDLPQQVYTVPAKKRKQAFTEKGICASTGDPIKISVEDNSGEMNSCRRLLSAMIKVVVLHGDFNVGNKDCWTLEDFTSHIVGQWDRAGPVLTGELELRLKNGEAQLCDANFIRGSKFVSSRKFRLGVMVVDELGERVQEGITEPFTVKDRREEFRIPKA
ncbi:hypothetical protein ACQJBY_019253 [Aegilops geniculata]